MAIVLDGTANTVTPLNGALGGTTPSTVVATTITASTAIGVASGGTGATTLTSGSVLVGAGTSAISSVAPGTSGNLLTSNGSAWVSSTPAGGGVTSLNGQTGAITNTALLAIGCYTLAFYGQGTETIGTTWAGSGLRYTSMAGTTGSAYIGSGTWRLMALVIGSTAPACSSLYVRIA